VSADTYLIYFN